MDIYKVNVSIVDLPLKSSIGESRELNSRPPQTKPSTASSLDYQGSVSYGSTENEIISSENNVRTFDDGKGKRNPLMMMVDSFKQLCAGVFMKIMPESLWISEHADEDLPEIEGNTTMMLPERYGGERQRLYTYSPGEETIPVDGFLAAADETKTNLDGSIDIIGGEWEGHTAVPTGDYGRYIIEDSSGEAVGYYQAPEGYPKIHESPLTFDLNGNGQVDTTGVNKQYDIDGDGVNETTAWAGDGDGVLAFDADGDGISGEDGTELFGNNSDVNGDGKIDGYANGFNALASAAYQNLPQENITRIKKTGVLNEEDILLLERPASEGGIGLTMMVDGEKVKPSELGITEISLEYEEAGSNTDINGNEHRQVGAGFTRNGELYAMNDVWFQSF